MLEFLLWAAAMAAILRGYDEDNRKSSVLLVRPELDPITTAPVIAAAYYRVKKRLLVPWGLSRNIKGLYLVSSCHESWIEGGEGS